MFRLTRIVSVFLLALAPLIGVQNAGAVGRSAWPIYPSMYFSSTLCQFAAGGGTAFVNCGPGGMMVSQIDSSYQCNQINVSESGYESGPVNLAMVTNDGLNSQSITIDGNGTWYIQIPGPFPLNAVVLQFSTPDGAGFLLPTIGSSPCPVATSTATAAPSNTPNPSDTATATVNPSFTPTAIPTHTPLPSGHATFTPTGTVTPGPTGSATNTPVPTLRNCGDDNFQIYNCDAIVGQDNPHDPSVRGQSPIPGTSPWYAGPQTGTAVSLGWEPCIRYAAVRGDSPSTDCGAFINDVLGWGDMYQTVTAGISGFVWGYISGSSTSDNIELCTDLDVSCQTAAALPADGSTEPATPILIGDVVSGTTYDFRVEVNGGNAIHLWQFYLTPYSSGTPLPSDTPTNTPDVTPTVGSPTATPYVNPFWTATPGTPGTAIPTDTECPGGCAVTALTTVPGVSTMITVDTNPFSPLTHLSLSRSPCTPFGYVQIPYPVITGTPALGQPLQFGWTVPITHTWDDTSIITNTAIQPCAMAKEVTPYVWDFTYWGSGVALAIVFTIWLIGWVGRLSGDHTVDG